MNEDVLLPCTMLPNSGSHLRVGILHSLLLEQCVSALVVPIETGVSCTRNHVPWGIAAMEAAKTAGAAVSVAFFQPSAVEVSGVETEVDERLMWVRKWNTGFP